MLRCLFIIIPILLIACEKDEDTPVEPDHPLVFQSLTADKDTLISGETTLIKAKATGIDLSYHWFASSGDILGSGAQVTFASTPCGCGGSRITCQVVDGYGKSDTKTIIIVVL